MQMTATEMLPAVGQVVRVRFEQIKVDARIMDVKMAWGNPRFRIVPMSGVGDQWVELSRIQVIPQSAELAVTRG